MLAIVNQAAVTLLLSLLSLLSSSSCRCSRRSGGGGRGKRVGGPPRGAGSSAGSTCAGRPGIRAAQMAWQVCWGVEHAAPQAAQGGTAVLFACHQRGRPSAKWASRLRPFCR